MIIDCHTHLSLMDKNDDYNLALSRFIDQMKKNNVSHAVIIADNVLGSGCADIDTLVSKFIDYDNISLVGAFYLYKSKTGEFNKLDQLIHDRKIIALKLFPGHDKVYPTDKRCNSTYELCLKYNVPVIIHTGINTGDFDCAKYNDPKHIIKIAQKYPKLKIVLAHYFWPKLDYCFEMTNDHSNIYYDTSALADDEVLDLSGGIEKMREILKKTIELKPYSVVFGTDYPMCDTKKHIDLINSLDISDELKENIFYKNAINLYLLEI